MVPEKINLLYIEDNDDARTIILEYLKKSSDTKFNTTCQTTLSDGLKFLDKKCKTREQCEIDVILLDLVLPNSHGVNTFFQVKEKCNFLPIVIISGYPEMACECVKLGAQDYLLKPTLNADLLIRSLKYAIERVKLENKFKDIVRTSSLGYHMYELKDDKLILNGYNPAVNSIMGITHEKFLGKEIQNILPDIEESFLDACKKAIDGTPCVNKVIQYHDKNFRVNAYKTGDNQLAITFEDITEKIKMEEKLKNSEKQYRHLIEVTKAGIYEIDFISQKYVYVNNVMCEITGWTREELLSMGPTELLTKESLENWEKRMDALKRGEHISDVFEYEIIAKDGSRLWGLITATFKEDKDKNIIGANVVAIDITDQKMVELALKKKEEEVYSNLENRIHKWKEEIQLKNKKKEQHLSLIKNEILSMTTEAI